jgi:hypothetical protein
MRHPFTRSAPPASIQGRPVHPEHAGNIDDSVTGVQPLDRLAALMSGKLERASESDAAPFGPLAAFTGPGFDERPLEFGEASQNRQHQHPMGRGGVAPCILERAEARR